MSPVFFFSHSGADTDAEGLLRSFFDRLVEAVRSDPPTGVGPGAEIGFADWGNREYGEDYADTLGRQLAACRVFVAVLSPTFFQEGRHCLRELEAFLDRAQGDFDAVLPVLWTNPARCVRYLEETGLAPLHRSIVRAPHYDQDGARALTLAAREGRGEELEFVLRGLVGSIGRLGEGPAPGSAGPLADIVRGAARSDSLAVRNERERIRLAVAAADLTDRVLGPLGQPEPRVPRGTLEAAFMAESGGAPPEGDLGDAIRRLARTEDAPARIRRFLDRIAASVEDPEGARIRRAAGLLPHAPVTSPSASAKETYRILIAVERTLGLVGEGLADYAIDAFHGPELRRLGPRPMAAREVEAKIDEVLLATLGLVPPEFGLNALRLELMLPLEFLIDHAPEEFLVSEGDERTALGHRFAFHLRLWDRVGDPKLALSRRHWQDKCRRLDGLVGPEGLAEHFLWLEWTEPAHALKDTLDEPVALGSVRRIPQDAGTRQDLLRKFLAAGLVIGLWPRGELPEEAQRGLRELDRRHPADLPGEIRRLRTKGGHAITLIYDRLDRLPREIAPSMSLPA